MTGRATPEHGRALGHVPRRATVRGRSAAVAEAADERSAVLRSRTKLSPTRAGLAALALAALPLASACTASYGAESQAPYTPDQGVWVDSGRLELRNLVIVSGRDGSGTLIGTVFNQGDESDALVEVDVRGGSAQVDPLPLPLAAGSPTVLGADTGLGEAVPTTVEGEGVRAGEVVRITFDFERTADVTTDVLVVAHEEPYEEVPVP